MRETIIQIEAVREEDYDTLYALTNAGNIYKKSGSKEWQLVSEGLYN